MISYNEATGLKIITHWSQLLKSYTIICGRWICNKMHYNTKYNQLYFEYIYTSDHHLTELKKTHAKPSQKRAKQANQSCSSQSIAELNVNSAFCWRSKQWVNTQLRKHIGRSVRRPINRQIDQSLNRNAKLQVHPSIHDFTNQYVNEQHNQSTNSIASNQTLNESVNWYMHTKMNQQHRTSTN